MSRVIGFAGGSGSGKTTVARHLADRLGPTQCASLTLDDFYHPLPQAYRAAPEAYNFDAPEALDSAALCAALEALHDGQDAEIPVYDFPSHDRRGTQVVLARPWLLLDGILVLALSEVRARLDLSFYIDVPEHVRLQRRIERDQRIRGRTLQEILEQYFATVRPMHEAYVASSQRHASRVLDGTRPLGALVDDILEEIARRFPGEGVG